MLPTCFHFKSFTAATLLNADVVITVINVVITVIVVVVITIIVSPVVTCVIAGSYCSCCRHLEPRAAFKAVVHFLTLC